MMQSLSINLAWLITSAGLLLTQSATASAESPRVGASAVVITPPKGTPMAGYYYERGALGTHDDLYAKAIVIEAGGSKAALVALDLISTTRDMVEDARREIEATTKIRGDAVMISATHAHTGPVLAGRGVRDVLMGGASPLALAFRETLPKKIAQAVSQAEAQLQPSAVSIGHANETSIAINRRFHMTDGTVSWNPGKLNPKIVKAAGTIDPDVAIASFESLDHKPIAAYVNYAVHLDNVGGQMFSADVPFTLSKLLGEALGPELVTAFTAGCCGDVNHIDVTWSRPQGGNGNAARMGTILAGDVLRAWPNLKIVQPKTVRSKTAIVRLPLAEISQDDVTKAREVADRREGATTAEPTFLTKVQAFKVLDVQARNGRPWEVEVQVIALDDQVAWVSLPGEMANGAIGYIPSRRAYPQGNYEVVSARCAAGSGEALVDAALELLRSIYAEVHGGKVSAGR
jgi:neutral ceramidase